MEANIETIMEIIMHSGNSRSYAMEAMQSAKEGDFENAKNLLEQADEEGLKAHHAQTALLQSEARGDKTEFSLLLVHAQDHLMTSMTLKDIAVEIVELREDIKK